MTLPAGIRLFVSPWVFGGYLNSNAWDGRIVGATIFVLGAIRIGPPLATSGLGWLNSARGVWTFAYTANTRRFISSLCAGTVAFLAAGMSANAIPHRHTPGTRMMQRRAMAAVHPAGWPATPSRTTQRAAAQPNLPGSCFPF